MTVAGIEIANPDKVLFPGDGITKEDLGDYYARVAEVMLPHLEGRPLHLQRFPDGIEGEEIQQKRVPDYFPEFVSRVEVPRKADDTEILHALAANADTLVYLADQACITPHAWLSRADRLDYPDQLVLDLDPPRRDLDLLRDAARALREVLEEIGLTCFVKATGSRGLHVVCPLDRRADFDEARAFAHGVADLVAARDADRLTTEPRKAKRRGRLYLDTTRNAYAQTAVAPYAVRARPGAPVATPLEWEELGKRDFNPGRYTMRNIFRRLSRKGDPWEGINKHASSLDGPSRRLDELRGEAGKRKR
jgi:bifunctional non-homologous end joining protein LigD